MQKLIEQPQVLRVSKEAIALCAPFAAVNDMRFFLNGVYVRQVEDGGVLAIATNGHAVICVRDPDGFADAPIILPVGKARNPALFKGKGGSVRLTADGVVFSESLSAVQFVAPEGPVDGQFPGILELFAGDKSQWAEGIRGAFDVRLLQLVAGAAGKEGVRFWTRTDAEGATTQLAFSIAQKAFGLVMPLRESVQAHIADLIPRWEA